MVMKMAKANAAAGTYFLLLPDAHMTSAGRPYQTRVVPIENATQLTTNALSSVGACNMAKQNMRPNMKYFGMLGPFGASAGQAGSLESGDCSAAGSGK
jgi:hypothetical protein